MRICLLRCLTYKIKSILLFSVKRYAVCALYIYMRKINSLFFGVRNFFFPGTCALCGTGLTGAGEIKRGLCEQCGASFSLVTDERCNLCGKPLISEKGFCLSCRNGEEHSFDRLWALFPYTGKYRRLLAAYKFGKNLALADFFAEKAAEVIAAHQILKNACIVPVPPRPGKIKDSGWDQVDCLVKRLEKLENGRISVSRCLKRRKSGIQKRLSRAERMENLKGRVYLCGKTPETVLVVDDIITTGSTMEVCSAALKAGGAQKVYGLCLFYD